MNDSILMDASRWTNATKEEREEVVQRLLKNKLGKAFDYTGQQEFSCGGQTHQVAVFMHTATKMLFHLLPGGSFTMGAGNNRSKIDEFYSTDMSENSRGTTIEIQPFLISRYLINEYAWKRFDGAALYEYCGNAHSLCAGRNEISDWGKKINARLPSEFEWEYACKAGTDTIFYWGDEPSFDHAWTEENTVFDDRNPGRKASEQKLPNAFGLLGMIGDSAEWVSDDAHDFGEDFFIHIDGFGSTIPFQNIRSENPDGVLRGGWDNYGWNFNRSTSRIRSSINDSCAARIVFGDLFDGIMIPHPEGRDADTYLVEIARQSKPESIRLQQGDAPRLLSYSFSANIFARFLDLGAPKSDQGSRPKDERKDTLPIRTLYLERFIDFTDDIDKDLKLRSGTAQSIWRDYLWGITHDDIEIIYWAFYEMFGQSFYGTPLKGMLSNTDMLLLPTIEGFQINKFYEDSDSPKFFQNVDRLTTLALYFDAFEVARASAKTCLSKDGFDLFSSWIDSMIVLEAQERPMYTGVDLVFFLTTNE